MSTRDHGSFPPPQAAVAPPPSHTGHSTASAYQNPSAINNNGGGGGKVGGGSAVGDDQYLAKAGEFNITQEDRQVRLPSREEEGRAAEAMARLTKNKMGFTGGIRPCARLAGTSSSTTRS